MNSEMINKMVKIMFATFFAMVVQTEESVVKVKTEMLTVLMELLMDILCFFQKHRDLLMFTLHVKSLVTLLKWIHSR